MFVYTLCIPKVDHPPKLVPQQQLLQMPGRHPNPLFLLLHLASPVNPGIGQCTWRSSLGFLPIQGFLRLTPGIQLVPPQKQLDQAADMPMLQWSFGQLQVPRAHQLQLALSPSHL